MSQCPCIDQLIVDIKLDKGGLGIHNQRHCTSESDERIRSTRAGDPRRGGGPFIPTGVPTEFKARCYFSVDPLELHHCGLVSAFILMDDRL